MTVYRPNNFIETYRLKASHDDIHELTGRGDFKKCSEFVLQNIINKLNPTQNDCIVDVGCGDGWLLFEISKKIQNGIGITASKEEADKLMQLYATSRNLVFQDAMAYSLPIGSETATKTICNSVFHFLQSRENLLKAFDEIIRVTRKGGLIWLGEIPCIDEQVTLKRKSTGVIKFLKSLKYLFQSNGAVGNFHNTKRILRFVLAKMRRKSVFIIHPKTTIFLESEILIKYACDRGLELISMETHVNLSAANLRVKVPSRINYLFRKL